MFALSLAAVVVALGVLLAALSARRRTSQERALTRALPHHDANVPQLVWTLSSYDGIDPVVSVLRSSSARTPEELMVELQQHLQEFSPEQRERIESAMAAHARATAEREIWYEHRQAVRGAVAIGAVDGLILGLGENPEWVTESLGSAASSAPEVLGGLLVGRFTRHALPEDWSEALAGNVADGIDGFVDPAVDAGIESLGGALGAIADAHVPVVSTTRAVLRAFKQHEAGLEGERVAENLMLDGGLTGGSAVAGAALGTAVFPVVGTVIGGMLGAFLGGSVAGELKSRHLRDAQRRAASALTELGMGVRSDRWASIPDEAEALLEERRTRLMRLAGSRRRRTPWARPHLGDTAISCAVQIGALELESEGQDVIAWHQDLGATSGSDQAWTRGAILVNRRDLVRRFEVPRKLARAAQRAQKDVQSEREKLALA